MNEGRKLDCTPIGQHGLIGDMETLALVGGGASIEWFCWPRFDSPSLFGRLLDPDGGCWSIEPSGSAWTDRQMYLPDTNVLVTRFHSDAGMVEVEDFMVVDHERFGDDGRGVIRRVTGVRGTIEMVSSMTPKPDYGRVDASIEKSERGLVIRGGEIEVELSATVALDHHETDRHETVIEATFELSEGETQCFALGTLGDDLLVDGLLEATSSYWRNWVHQAKYRGRYREIVLRSALTLKLLTHRASGGMLAAGTTSLPEQLGGDRNWDYRYVWIRDAAFTLYAFIELGFIDEADAFTRWLSKRVAECPNDSGSGSGLLSPLYDLDGRTDLTEYTLDHWSGYAGSGPVRIGNAAADQLQLDAYGELLDSLYLADKHGGGLPLDTWRQITRLVDWVCGNWDQPDDGIWEVRSGRERFTSSALMCWVALERGVRMAEFRGRPADLNRWRSTRDQIHEAILDRGWNADLGAFTQTFDGDQLDASLLLMPLVKFVSGDDPQWLSTLDAIEHSLIHGVLVDRYDNALSDDGLAGDDGSFTICSFWYVENLVRAGRLEEAEIRFEKLLTFAGPLGLFSEVISPSGDQLGNYPQAFTHLALISAAVHLDQYSERS